MSKLLSIIIPIHNGERTIVNTIESVLKINEKDLYEILCVDDCSTDNTLDLIHKNYSSLKNLRVIHIKKQVGCGLARNLAINEAKGDYISFLDADDQYLFKEINFLDKLISLYNSDLYLFNYKITKPNGSIEIVQSFDEKYNIELHQCPSVIKKRPCWSIIYKKKFLIDENIFFKRGIWEDKDFVVETLCNSKKITQINKFLIDYDKTVPLSITSKKKTISDLNLIYDQLENSSNLATNYRTKSEKIYQISISHNFNVFLYFYKEISVQEEISDKILLKFKKLFMSCEIKLDKFEEEELEGIGYNVQKDITFIYYIFINYNSDIFRKLINKKIPNEYLDRILDNNFLKEYLKKNESCLYYFDYKDNVLSNAINLYSIKNIYIHIGLPKTGTTNIQHFLHAQGEKLLKYNILYPLSVTSKKFQEAYKIQDQNFGNSLLDHNYLSSIKNKSAAHHSFFFQELSKEIKDNINCDTLILSAENLYYLDEYSISLLKKYFININTKIIFSSRNYFDWLNSFYVENIVSGREHRSFNYFFNHCTATSLIPYEKKTNLWKKIFGNNNFVEINYKDNEEFTKNLLFKLKIPIEIVNDYKNKKIYSYNKDWFKIYQILNFNKETKDYSFENFIKEKNKFFKFLNSNSLNLNDKTHYIDKNIFNFTNYSFLKNHDFNLDGKFIETIAISKLINYTQTQEKKNKIQNKILYNFIKEKILSNKFIYLIYLKIYWLSKKNKYLNILIKRTLKLLGVNNV